MPTKNPVWYIQDKSGTHAIIGEYSVCGMAFDELILGTPTFVEIVTCADCIERIKLISAIKTAHPPQPANTKVCKKCNGKGVTTPRKYTYTCKVCNGRGYIPK